MGAKLARDAGTSVHQGPRRLYRGQALLPQVQPPPQVLFPQILLPQ
ncbi:hypothetical protein AK973_4772 [Pseudomonas brassicacearum]|nr:hypothetical protein AK973_4772 [Pseudomonas brassicacearum]